MRQVGGDGEHEVVMARLHVFDGHAGARPERVDLLDRVRVACSGSGVRMHQRPSNSSAKPASGPECSVPATGWAGTKCTPAGMSGPSLSMHRLLDRADIGDDRRRA